MKANINQDKDFMRLKRYVDKKFPGAHTVVRMLNGQTTYQILDGRGRAVVGEELFIPPAMTVRKAWEYAKYAAWFSNMIRKSNAAFSDEKMYKKLAKETGDY
jgi:hypothetical protein